jgi:class 3 adenylate cyclase
MITTARAATPLLLAFIDLSRFSKESLHRDDEQVAETIDAYYGLVSHEIAGAGGRVVKFIGDAALIVFPEAAADAGVRVLVRLKSSVEAMLAAQGWNSRLGAKVHVGSAIAGDFGPPGDMRYDVIGRAVNETAMMPTTDRIVLSDAARRHVSADTHRLLENA